MAFVCKVGWSKPWLLILFFLAARPLIGAPLDPLPLKIPRVTRAPKLSDFLNGTPREAESAGVRGSIAALAEGESWVAAESEVAEQEYRRLV